MNLSNMREIQSNDIQELEPRSRNIISRGPGRAFTEEISRIIDLYCNGEPLELEFPGYFLRIEKIVK